jgi:hypothetical protein
MKVTTNINDHIDPLAQAHARQRSFGIRLERETARRRKERRVAAAALVVSAAITAALVALAITTP